MKLDMFLKAIESSGVVVVFVEDAVIGRLRESSVMKFSTLAKLHLEIDSAAAADMAHRMFVAFKVSVENMASDPVGLTYLRSVSDRLAEHMHDIDDNLSRLLDGMAGYSLKDIGPCLEKIARALNAEFKINWIETSKGRKQVGLEKIYIPGRVKIRRDDTYHSHGLGTLQLPALSTSSLKDGGRKLLQMGRERDDGSLSFVEFQRYLRRAVVLGDPGGGKSTLCQYMCFSLSSKYLNSNKTNDRAPDSETQSAKIPIRVVLRSFELARAKRPQLGILDYIVSEISRVVSTDERVVKASLLYALEFGFVFLAFDGLDEILDTARRREYVDVVRAFADNFPLCPVLVTSRIVGYDDAPLSSDFEQVVLERFDKGEVTSYVTKFLQHVCAHEKIAAERLTQKFLEQTDENASDLRHNPLMLGLMAFIFNAKGDVPSNRPEIYRECAMLMFEKWDQNRSIRADIPVGFDMLHLFGTIASQMFGRVELEEGVSTSWLEDACKRYFSSIYEEKSKAHEAAKKVVGFLAGRSWVLTEVGVGKYRFTHRTFMEFFFAQQVSEERESVSDLLSFLLPKIRAREWDVIAHLSLQIKTFRSPRRTADAALLLHRSLIEDLSPSDGRLALCEFVSACLTYVIPTEADVRALVEAIVRLAPVATSGADYPKTLRVWRTLANAHAERRTYVHGVLAHSLAQRFLADDDVASQLGIALALSCSPSFEFLYPKYWYQDVLLPNEISSISRSALRGPLLSMARNDSRLAYVYFEWFLSDLAELVKIHGLSFLARDPRPWPDGPLRGVSVAMFRIFQDAVGQTTASRAEFLAGSSAAILRTIGQNINIGDKDTYNDYPALGYPVASAALFKKTLSNFAKEPIISAGLVFVVHAITRKACEIEIEVSKTFKQKLPIYFADIYEDEKIAKLIQDIERHIGDGSMQFWWVSSRILRNMRNSGEGVG